MSQYGDFLFTTLTEDSSEKNSATGVSQAFPSSGFKSCAQLLFALNVVLLSQISWKAVCWKDSISSRQNWSQIYLGTNNSGWDFFREVRAARMAVAARQRREEKVCSSTKLFLEGKHYERLFLDGKWYEIWSFRWNLRGYRLATPSSTSPSLPTHSRLAYLSMEKWPNEV